MKLKQIIFKFEDDIGEEHTSLVERDINLPMYFTADVRSPEEGLCKFFQLMGSKIDPEAIVGSATTKKEN